jgi:hypothetical protein
MAQWVGAQYEIGGRIVSETLMTLAQVGAANAQALCYFGVWLLWTHQCNRRPATRGLQ